VWCYPYGDYESVLCVGLAPRQLESSPALHVYGCLMHTEGSDQAPLSHSPLLFFEALTLWIRPLELKLEESVVRTTHTHTQTHLSLHKPCGLRVYV
jgi:hypothetical protein